MYHYSFGTLLLLDFDHEACEIVRCHDRFVEVNVRVVFDHDDDLRAGAGDNEGHHLQA